MKINKFKKVFAALLAVTMMFLSINVIYAEAKNKTSTNNELVADEVLSGGAVADNTISLMSLLPLEENEAALVLNDYTSEELKRFSVQKMIDSLQDSDGNRIDIADDAEVTMRSVKDGDGKTIVDEYKLLSRDEDIDLSMFENTSNYTMELIVGSSNQLDYSNVRYIVRIYGSENVPEKIDWKFYTEVNGKREKIEFLQTTDVSSDMEFPATDKVKLTTCMAYITPKNNILDDASIYVGLTSDRIKHPDYDVKLYYSYNLETPFAFYENSTEYEEYTEPINELALNQNIENDKGQKLRLGNTIGGIALDFNNFWVMYLKKDANGNMVPEEVYRIIFFVNGSINKSYIGNINTFENNEIKNITVSSTATSETPDDIIIDNEGNISTAYTEQELKYILGKNYDTDREYYFKLNAATQRDWKEEVKKAVVGYYDSEDEAKDVVDIKEEIYGENSPGYKANYSNDGVKFTVFYVNDSTAHKFTVKTIATEEYYIEFDSSPIVGKADPYFRLTGVEGKDGYAIENGGTYNLDTYYGYGYHTVLINDESADLSKLKPEFWFAADDYFNLYKVDSDSRKLQDVNNPDSITKKNQQYALAWKNDDTGQKVRNYWLSVVKKTSGGPKLFVDGPGSGETREVLLTDYFENKHDVFVANTGDEPMYISARLSDDAKNVKLDDYWTIGGENNQELKAFTTTENVSDYSELPNVAKVRLLRPDTVEGDGAVSGQLVIEASGGLVNGELDKNNEYYETYVIQLNDKAENPQIINESVSDAVKYVPYQEIIATDNIHEENIVTYKLTGELPDGVTFNEGTGEIYGVPKDTGKYKFTVQANFSDSSFESVEKEFTLNVKDNSDDNVASEIDEGFEIITPIADVEVTEGEAIPELVFEFEYDYSEHEDEFQGVWLDGEKLIEDIDYIVEDGSTKITLKSQTSSNDYSGSHTIAAEYRNNNNQVKKSAQNYNVKVNEKNSGDNPSSGGSTGGGSTSGGSSTSSKRSSGGTNSTRYTVSYDSNGGTEVQSQSVIRGQKITFLATPIKPGYVFAGWYTNKELTKKFDKNTAINTSLKLYAKWERADCTVWFESNGGAQINSIQMKGDNVIESLPEPEKEGYKFAGWFKDTEFKTPFGAEDKITENTTLYAKWELIIPDEAPEKVSGFIDVEENAWYYDDINWAYDNNIMVGYNNAIFAPKNSVTESNIVTIFAKLCGADVSEYSNTSVDGIADNMWYSNYVKWANNEGLIDAASFEPNKAVSRQDIAVMITKLLDYAGADYSSGNMSAEFNDEMLISDEAKDSVTKLYNSGVISGRDDNTFDPMGNTTRGEFAALIHRIYTLNLLK